MCGRSNRPSSTPGLADFRRLAADHMQKLTEELAKAMPSCAELCVLNSARQ